MKVKLYLAHGLLCVSTPRPIPESGIKLSSSTGHTLTLLTLFLFFLISLEDMPLLGGGGGGGKKPVTLLAKMEPKPFLV